MTTIDLPADLIHGTREGYVAGCRSRINCPSTDANGFCFIDANIRYNGDYRFRVRADQGLAPAEIAALDMADAAEAVDRADTSRRTARKKTPRKPVRRPLDRSHDELLEADLLPLRPVATVAGAAEDVPAADAEPCAMTGALDEVHRHMVTAIDVNGQTCACGVKSRMLIEHIADVLLTIAGAPAPMAVPAPTGTAAGSRG